MTIRSTHLVPWDWLSAGPAFPMACIPHGLMGACWDRFVGPHGGALQKDCQFAFLNHNGPTGSSVLHYTHAGALIQI